MADGRRSATLGSLFAETRAILTKAGLADAALDARLIVEHFTATQRAQSLLEPDQHVDEAAADAVQSAVRQRLAGMPVHRILGFREFYGLAFELSPHTLEPRPDTEALVDLVLPFVRGIAQAAGGCDILDMGTGTGAIVISLLRHESAARGLATDISPEALATARRNADINGVGDRLDTMSSDWFADVEGRFHVIVSNPPYIPASEIAGLQREVRDHDPRAALDGGEDGLNAYRAIAKGAHACLKAQGCVAVEIGHEQKRDVEAIFGQEGFVLTAEAKDLAGRDRALLFQAP